MFAFNESKLGNNKISMKISDLKLEWQEKNILIVGCGASGISCANFLSKYAIKFSIVDSRTNLANVADIKQKYEVVFGEFQEEHFSAADILIVSPGVSIKHPYIQTALQEGKEVLGDVDLFCRLTDTPIIAITGSNGKSTVTTLVGEILHAANMNVKVGGNIGVPCLDLLSLDYHSENDFEAETDCYVLELSSFQLETTSHLHSYASVILNLSEDHMDRYDSFSEYCKAKQQIFKNSKDIIINLDDDLAKELSGFNQQNNNITFSLNSTSKADFYIYVKDGNEWVFYKDDAVIDISKIKIVGQHNKLNILAALSLCSVFNVDLKQAGKVIKNFSGLEHRSQVVSSQDGVLWINDSKATNIGATSAALKGFDNNVIHLILGGQAKGQDFSELIPVLTSNIKQIVVYGEDADLILHSIEKLNTIKLSAVQTLEQAVDLIKQSVVKNDAVLFSPACASFDQYDNYMHRGQSFINIVQRVKN